MMHRMMERQARHAEEVTDSPSLLLSAPAGGRWAGEERRAAGNAARRARRRVEIRDSYRRRLLVGADVLTALLAFGAVAILSDERATIIAAAFVPVWVLVAKVQGLYDRDHRTLRHLTVDEIPQLLTWAVTGTMLLGLLFLATSTDGFDGVFGAVFVTALISSLLLRAIVRALWRRVMPPERALIIGDGSLAGATRRKFELFPDSCVRVVDIIPPGDIVAMDGQCSPDRLVGIDRVILASHNLDEDVLAEFVRVCREWAIKMSVVPPVRGMFGTAVELRHIAELPFVEYNTWHVARSTLVLKRTLDLSVAMLATVALLPVAALIALAIRRDSPGPVVFAQWRSGRFGRPFRIYKFRTMVSDAEQRLAEVVSIDGLPEPMFKFESDPRVTRVGRFLRRTSLDEIPQLLNVLRGDMSLVGPRPEQVDLVERYAAEHRFRLDVKPGITGPMQVFGRGELTFEERLAVEREYIENHSLARDMRLLALTVGVVAGRRGAY